MLLDKMVLNMQQQLTVAAWAIAYQNDCEAVHRWNHVWLTKCDFNISLLLSTVGKWRKQLLTMGNIQKGQSTGRPHSTIIQQHQKDVTLWKCLSIAHTNRSGKVHMSLASVSLVCLVFWNMRDTISSNWFMSTQLSLLCYRKSSSYWKETFKM